MTTVSRVRKFKAPTGNCIFRIDLLQLEIARRICGMHGITLSSLLGDYLESWVKKNQAILPESVLADCKQMITNQ